MWTLLFQIYNKVFMLPCWHKVITTNIVVAQRVNLPFSFPAATCAWHSRPAAEGSPPGLTCDHRHVSSSHCSSDRPTCLYKWKIAAQVTYALPENNFTPSF